MANESQRLGDRLEQMDKEIRNWSKLTRQKLLNKILSLDLRGQLELQKSLKNIVRKKSGDIESVGFSFARHGIFLEHGVGRGRPVGSEAARKSQKKWLSVQLPPSIEDLADILEENYADITAAALVINIPGIIDTKINK